MRATPTMTFTTTDGGSAITDNAEGATAANADGFGVGARFTTSGAETGRVSFSDLTFSAEL